ncbi:MAG: RidA family protein [Actinobacteria bacterium]|uniref:Unannotated protein n=1 Tax=freshwater metagenome TaxID=449393 RepID=A0A6J7GES0_9ZZZZ|nr:RidA family protein [Actinomycetota bacterium]
MADPAGTAVPPQGDYAAAVRHGSLVATAGMTPRRAGILQVRGTVGAEVDLDAARDAAALAAGNALVAVEELLGGLDEVEGVLRMTVYVAAVPGFEQHSAVADGASRALTTRLGARGRAARAAVGVAGLPSGAPVEVDLLVALRSG